MFYDVLARLDAARFTSHLLDFHGCGLSDRSSTDHGVESYALDLRAALAAIDGDVTIVAHSMGGKIAQYVALEPPAHLKRLILVGPGSPRANRGSASHRRLAEEAFGSRERIARFQRAAMVRPVSADVLERIVDDALIAQREAWFDYYDRGRSFDFSDRVAAIALPTLVVAGERDPLAPPSRLRTEVTSAIPGARIVTLRDVGHNIPVEAPAELAGIIERTID